VWESALVLVGAILAPGKRTVSAILRVMGLHHEHNFQNYHRVLNRAVWSSRHASKLLQQIVRVFAPTGYGCFKPEQSAHNSSHHIVEAGIRRKKS